MKRKPVRPIRRRDELPDEEWSELEAVRATGVGAQDIARCAGLPVSTTVKILHTEKMDKKKNSKRG